MRFKLNAIYDVEDGVKYGNIQFVLWLPPVYTSLHLYMYNLSISKVEFKTISISYHRAVYVQIVDFKSEIQNHIHTVSSNDQDDGGFITCLYTEHLRSSGGTKSDISVNVMPRLAACLFCAARC